MHNFYSSIVLQVRLLLFTHSFLTNGDLRYLFEKIYQYFCLRPTLVNLFLHPSTGDDDHNSKYVCLNLVLTISEKYPFHCPGISIKNPRGLSDAHCVR